jgi:hypothetical protein
LSLIIDSKTDLMKIVYRAIDSQFGDDYRHEFESVFRRFETIEENSRLEYLMNLVKND